MLDDEEDVEEILKEKSNDSIAAKKISRVTGIRGGIDSSRRDTSQSAERKTHNDSLNYKTPRGNQNAQKYTMPRQMAAADPSSQRRGLSSEDSPSNWVV